MNKDIMAIQYSFSKLFDVEWRKTMQTLHCNQSQLLIGSRLRPQIVLWGYLTCVDTSKELALPEVSYLAVSIELIHKASLLLDDWIDDDTARHGENAFHIDYGAHSAVMMAMLMVTEALNRLTKTQFPDTDNYECLETIIRTAKAMTCGALEELSLDKGTQFDYEINKRIALLETAEIISCSLLLGHSLCENKNSELNAILSKIGELCGFLFQTQNDLESFSHAAKNKQYKGKENYDFNRYRKNLVVSRLYGLLSKKEKAILLKADNPDDVEKLLCKYKVIELTMREMEIVFDEIINLISCAQRYGATYTWSIGFAEFMHMLKKTAYERLT